MKLKLIALALLAASAAFSQVAEAEPPKPKKAAPVRTELAPAQVTQMAQAALKVSALENRARALKEEFTAVQAQLQQASSEYEAGLKKHAAEHHAEGCTLDLTQKWSGCPAPPVTAEKK